MCTPLAETARPGREFFEKLSSDLRSDRPAAERADADLRSDPFGGVAIKPKNGYTEIPG